MRYYYRPIPEPLRPWLASLYLLEMKDDYKGLLRVGIPHIRFICRGALTLEDDRENRIYGAPQVVVGGPTFRIGPVHVAGGTLIVGATLTPAGWQALAACPADQMANRKSPVQTLRPDLDPEPTLRLLTGAAPENAAPENAAPEHAATHATATADDDALFDAVTGFLGGAFRPVPVPRWDFITAAMDWAADPDSPGVSDLVARTGLSPRQVDRLCRSHFGDSPKQVHCVFRALHVCYELATRADVDFRDLTGPYCDQSHMIRDFKNRIGCTPERFRQDRAPMMRMELALRRKVPFMTSYGLIG